VSGYGGDDGGVARKNINNNVKEKLKERRG